MKKNLITAFLILALVVTAILIRQGDKAIHKSVSKEKPTPAKLDVTQNQIPAAPASPTTNDLDPTPEAKLVKIDDNGTRIYQVDGTQVTVSKDGELFFLPSKI